MPPTRNRPLTVSVASDVEHDRTGIRDRPDWPTHPFRPCGSSSGAVAVGGVRVTRELVPVVATLVDVLIGVGGSQARTAVVRSPDHAQTPGR